MFDPYHKWLGIPKVQRPPTHYQLLGLAPDESDLEVIAEAAIRQTTHVRVYQIGPHATDCTRLLKEIATARLTLLNPAKRKEYDAQLAQAGRAEPVTAIIAEPAPRAAPVAAAVAAEIVRPVSPAPSGGRVPAIAVLIGFGAAAMLLVLVVIGIGAAYYVLGTPGTEAPARQVAAVAKAGTQKPPPGHGEPAKKPPEPPKKAEEPAAKKGMDDAAMANVPDGTAPKDPAQPGGVPANVKPPPKEPLPATASGNPSVAKPSAPERTKRQPVPEADKLLAAGKTIRVQFQQEYAKKAPADALALANRLHKLAGETSDDPASGYVLLREARDLAAKAGRAELALKIVADLGERFAIDTAGLRAETVAGMAGQKLSTEAAKEFVEVALQAVGHAIADDELDAAQKMLAAAQTVARRIGSGALTALVQQHDKQLKEITTEFAEVRKAQETLAANPKDAPASLTVGLYLSFRKGNWAKGLPLLAQSSDIELRELAKRDLAAGDDLQAQLHSADTWWTVAQIRPPMQKAAMQWRAAALYRGALPSLNGLNEAKANDRIRQADALPPAFRILAGLGEVGRLKGHAGFVNWLSVSADGKQVYSAGQDGTLRVWNIATGKSRVLLGPPLVTGPIVGVALPPDMQHAALLYADGRWDLFSSATGKRANGSEQEVVPGLFWRDNAELQFIDKKTWHTYRHTPRSGGAGPLLVGGPALRGNVRALVMAPELDMGALLVAADQVLVFTIPVAGLRRLHVQIPIEATTAAFPKDNRFVVLGGKDGKLGAYDLRITTNEPAKEIAVFKGHTGTVRTATCTPDGKRVVSGGSDKTLRVWDAASGKQLQSYGHPAAVTCVVVSPDAHHAISGCADGIIRVWTLPSDYSPQRHRDTEKTEQ
jgi:hypothetical protein